MSGSQPATVGELHPLHRKALRHPLILDGLLTTPRLAARRHELCLHVLSSFQRTGLASPDERARGAKSGSCSPSSLTCSGEPSYITERRRLCQPLRRIFCRRPRVPRFPVRRRRNAVRRPNGTVERALANGCGKRAWLRNLGKKKICSREQIVRPAWPGHAQ
jgi:hypothetical protein